MPGNAQAYYDYIVQMSEFQIVPVAGFYDSIFPFLNDFELLPED